MPHSAQTRTRCVGSGVFDEKRRLRNDILHLRFVVQSSFLRPGGRAGYRVPEVFICDCLDSVSRKKVRPSAGTSELLLHYDKVSVALQLPWLRKRRSTNDGESKTLVV